MLLAAGRSAGDERVSAATRPRGTFMQIRRRLHLFPTPHLDGPIPAGTRLGVYRALLNKEMVPPPLGRGSPALGSMAWRGECGLAFSSSARSLGSGHRMQNYIQQPSSQTLLRILEQTLALERVREDRYGASQVVPTVAARHSWALLLSPADPKRFKQERSGSALTGLENPDGSVFRISLI